MDRKEISDRRKRLFAQSKGKMGSFLFYNGDDGAKANFSYFSGCDEGGSYLVLKQSGGLLFTNEMNLQSARENSVYPVKLSGRTREQAVRAISTEAGKGKVGCPLSDFSAGRFLALRKRAGLKLVDASEQCLAVRGRKSGREILKLSESAKVTKKILHSLDPWEHKTEEELLRGLKIRALQEGCDTAFEPIVATGRNSNKPHHVAGKKRLEDFVLVDFGVRKGGYCSDFTRCYFKRKDGPEWDAYSKCRQMFEELIDGLDGCNMGHDVAGLSEKLMKKRGFPPLIHSIGHGIGLEVHEYPHLGALSDEFLDGAALAIEPAGYFGRFGARFEGMAARKNKRWRIL